VSIQRYEIVGDFEVVPAYADVGEYCDSEDVSIIEQERDDFKDSAGFMRNNLRFASRELVTMSEQVVALESKLSAIRTVVEGDLSWTDTAILVKRILDEGE